MNHKLLCTIVAGLIALAAEAAEKRATVRDHLWIFTVFAGGESDYLERGNVRGGSRMTPAAKADWMS
ncbi:MAG: hypothetical protein N3B01_09210 [Verrucomicrobiae bacterium]|nr:hypothetical protein [Verrucomicrobiae bacterium]